MKLSSSLCKKIECLGVVGVYLFGSQAQEIAGKESDFDFGILLKKPFVIKEESMGLYQKIYELLEELAPGKNLDIVFLDRAPLQLRYHVLRCGQALYTGDAAVRAHFEERTLEEYADFEPYRRLFEQATLAQI